MIHDVDETLKGVLRSGPLSNLDIELAFEAPTRDWAARRNAPTVDLYLYDIREDVSRREQGRIDLRTPAGRVTERLVPPRWFKLSYLLTAWTQRAEDEHRLLTACLGELIRHDRLPPDHLAGSLAELGLPIAMTVALPPLQERALSDVWSALGGELKPSLDVVVLAPFDTARTFEAGPPVLERPRVQAGYAARGSGDREEWQGGDDEQPGRRFLVGELQRGGRP